MTIVIGEPVDVEVVIPPILVVDVEILTLPLVTVLHPSVTVMVDGPSTPVVSIPVVPGPEGPPGEPGPQGPPGEPGIGTHGGSFIFLQASPSSIWDIIHNLDYTPNVLVADSSGSVLTGDVEIISPTHLQVLFSVPISGVAYLS